MTQLCPTWCVRDHSDLRPGMEGYDHYSDHIARVTGDPKYDDATVYVRLRRYDGESGAGRIEADIITRSPVTSDSATLMGQKQLRSVAAAMQDAADRTAAARAPVRRDLAVAQSLTTHDL